jgi:hypothetical protein
MRGAGRATTPKNARQNTVEMLVQEISKIAMRLHAASTVPQATREP